MFVLIDREKITELFVSEKASHRIISRKWTPCMGMIPQEQLAVGPSEGDLEASGTWVERRPIAWGPA